MNIKLYRYMYVLSIDTATKSLAISLIFYNLNLSNDIDKEYENYLKEKANINKDDSNKLFENYLNLLTKVDTLLENKIIIHHLEVIDLIPGKKVKEASIQEISKSLHNYLNNVIDPIIAKYNKTDEIKNDWLFLLEKQMSPNNQSNSISSMIIYHLSKYDAEIQLVGPTLKNKIIVGGSKSYSDALESHSTNYAANKSHSKGCFLELLKHLKKEDLLDVCQIKKKNVDDISDSTMQSLAYVIQYKGF